MSEVCNDRARTHRSHSRGSHGAFDAYHGWNDQAQFPAHLETRTRRCIRRMSAEPNAWLSPQARGPMTTGLVWSQAGTLQVTCDVQYDSHKE